MNTGPKLKNDNLVFGYDTGYGVADNNTGTRFYSGNPTSNIVPDAYTMSGWGNYSSGNDGTFITEHGTTGYKVRNKNTWNGIVKGITLPSTGTYTISAWFRIWGKSSGNNGINVYTNGGGISDTAQGGDDTKIGEWQRIAMTRTYSTTSINFYIISWGGTSGVDWSSWDVTMPQIEKQSTHSPFLTGTRSDTASLIDLKKTRDIDVSNVSFDSNGQPEFDGTNDYISITDLLNSEGIGANTNLTISMWLKPGSYGYKMPFSTGQNGDDRIYYWTNGSVNTWRVGNYTSTSGHGALPSVGTWFNTVLVINGTNVTAYLNGEEDYTGTYTAFTTADYATFGKHGTHSGGYLFDGTIAVARIHNTSLTATEIKNNFNAYKNRFDL